MTYGAKVRLGVSLLFALITVVTLQGIRVERSVTGAEPSYWNISLEDLEYSHITVSTGEKVNVSESISIPLPEGAQQGPEDWWLLYTHFNVEFDPTSGPGIVWISAGTNDRIAVQLKIIVLDPGSGYLASRVELLNGPSLVFTLNPEQTYHVANYLQIGGVQPGQVDLEFHLRKTGDVRVDRLTFLNDSSVIRIPVGPPKLEIDATFPKEEIVLGSEFPLDIHLSSFRWPVKFQIVRLPQEIDATFPKEEIVLGSEFPLDIHLSSFRWPVRSPIVGVLDPDEAFQIVRLPQEKR